MLIVVVAFFFFKKKYVLETLLVVLVMVVDRLSINHCGHAIRRQYGTRLPSSGRPSPLHHDPLSLSPHNFHNV